MHESGHGIIYKPHKIAKCMQGSSKQNKFQSLCLRLVHFLANIMELLMFGCICHYTKKMSKSYPSKFTLKVMNDLHCLGAMDMPSLLKFVTWLLVYLIKMCPIPPGFVNMSMQVSARNTRSP